MVQFAGNLNVLIDRAVQLQRSYWTFDPEERDLLLSRYPDSLSWAELFRLHHLNCLDFFTTDEGRRQLFGEVFGEGLVRIQDAPEGFTNDLCKELIIRFMSKKSPFRARPFYVWQGNAKQLSNKSYDLFGKLRNASVTHLGCFEVMHLDEGGLPIEVSFIPLADIKEIIFAPPLLFRFAKVLYEDDRDMEIVLVPLLYGLSWFTDNEFDHNGSMTRFICSMKIEGLEARTSIGVGHQDLKSGFESGEGGDYLFGIGSVSKILSGLAIDDACI